jgi:hypothetical protein
VALQVWLGWMEGKVGEEVVSSVRSAVGAFVRDNRLTKEKINVDLAQCFDMADRLARG